MRGSLDIAGIAQLLREFEQRHSARGNYQTVLEELQRETQFPELEEYLRWELLHNLSSVEYVAEFLALYQPTPPVLNRDQMLALVRRISNAEGSRAEIDTMVAVFDANCKHPDKNGLIFWPDGFPHDPSKPEPTVEEIVDRAMTGRE